MFIYDSDALTGTYHPAGVLVEAIAFAVSRWNGMRRHTSSQSGRIKQAVLIQARPFMRRLSSGLLSSREQVIQEPANVNRLDLF